MHYAFLYVRELLNEKPGGENLRRVGLKTPYTTLRLFQQRHPLRHVEATRFDRIQVNPC